METRNVLPEALEVMKDWGGCTCPDNALTVPSATILASVPAHPSLITSVHFSVSPLQREKSYHGPGFSQIVLEVVWLCVSGTGCAQPCAQEEG